MVEILKEILSQIQTMSNKIDIRLNGLENMQDATNKRLTKMETKIENGINVKIQVLFENRQIVHRKLDKITYELTEIKEHITDHYIKIRVISNKTKAI